MAHADARGWGRVCASRSAEACCAARAGAPHAARCVTHHVSSRPLWRRAAPRRAAQPSAANGVSCESDAPHVFAHAVLVVRVVVEEGRVRYVDLHGGVLARVARGRVPGERGLVEAHRPAGGHRVGGRRSPARPDARRESARHAEAQDSRTGRSQPASERGRRRRTRARARTPSAACAHASTQATPRLSGCRASGQQRLRAHVCPRHCGLKRTRRPAAGSEAGKCGVFMSRCAGHSSKGPTGRRATLAAHVWSSSTRGASRNQGCVAPGWRPRARARAPARPRAEARTPSRARSACHPHACTCALRLLPLTRRCIRRRRTCASGAASGSRARYKRASRRGRARTRREDTTTRRACARVRVRARARSCSRCSLWLARLLG